MERVNVHARAFHRTIVAQLQNVLPRDMVVQEIEGIKRRRKKTTEGDGIQWHRWYQVNQKRQRRLAALKRLDPNFKIAPHTSALPRWCVP